MPVDIMKKHLEQNNHFEFEEKQKLKNWLAWIIILGTLALTVTILIYQLITGNRVGNNPASNGFLICMICLLYLPLILAMLHATLTVRIDKTTIFYGWNLPTNDLNKINVSDIVSADIIEYSFVGYGYRLTRKYGTVYNTSGNQGLLLKTRSNEKILLGTHKATELGEVLTKLDIRPTSSKVR